MEFQSSFDRRVQTVCCWCNPNDSHLLKPIYFQPDPNDSHYVRWYLPIFCWNWKEDTMSTVFWSLPPIQQYCLDRVHKPILYCLVIFGSPSKVIGNHKISSFLFFRLEIELLWIYLRIACWKWKWRKQNTKSWKESMWRTWTRKCSHLQSWLDLEVNWK